MSKATSPREQRRFNRQATAEASGVSVRTVAGRADASIHLDSVDLSEGGAFLRSELLFEIGESLQLEIPLAGGKTVRATAKVVRVTRAHDGRRHPGMGVEFTRFALGDRRLLAASLGGPDGAPPAAG